MKICRAEFQVEVAKVGRLKAEGESNGEDGAGAGAPDQVEPVGERQRAGRSGCRVELSISISASAGISPFKPPPSMDRRRIGRVGEFGVLVSMIYSGRCAIG